MQYLIESFPGFGNMIIALLLGILGWFMVHTLETNTKTQDKLTQAIEVVTEEIHTIKIQVAEHELRLGICEDGG